MSIIMPIARVCVVGHGWEKSGIGTVRTYVWRWRCPQIVYDSAAADDRLSYRDVYNLLSRRRRNWFSSRFTIANRFCTTGSRNAAPLSARIRGSNILHVLYCFFFTIPACFSARIAFQSRCARVSRDAVRFPCYWPLRRSLWNHRRRHTRHLRAVSQTAAAGRCGCGHIFGQTVRLCDIHCIRLSFVHTDVIF